MNEGILIAGLGNPGKEYEHTKHNIGQDVFSALSFNHTLTYSQKFKGRIASTRQKEHFLIPQTFMNLSGQSVQPALSFYKLPPAQLLVLHDELDLEFGTIAYKFGGGLAGHNGLKSIAQELGTQDFYRMRIGIGRPVHGSVSDWVLSRFHGDQSMRYEDYLKLVAEAVEDIIKIGLNPALKKYTRKKLWA